MYDKIVQNKKIKIDTIHLLQIAALVYRYENDQLQFLLITSRRTKRFVLPKGWPQIGKTLPQSALSEAYEEAGICGTVSASPIGHYFYTKPDRAPHKNPHFRVDVFSVKFSHQVDDWPEKQEREWQWFIPHEAAQRVDEPLLKEILLSFLP